jgi:hypothetical protein
MLFKKTVAPATWQLLTELMLLPSLQNFGLVGGTNLSLRYGHRLSIDLDLFTNEPFENDKILAAVIFCGVIFDGLSRTGFQPVK